MSLFPKMGDAAPEPVPVTEPVTPAPTAHGGELDGPGAELSCERPHGRTGRDDVGGARHGEAQLSGVGTAGADCLTGWMQGQGVPLCA